VSQREFGRDRGSRLIIWAFSSLLWWEVHLLNGLTAFSRSPISTDEPVISSCCYKDPWSPPGTCAKADMDQDVVKPPGSLAEALLRLPTEIRLHIFRILFDQSRITVTAPRDCHCETTRKVGPYTASHQWLLHPGSAQIRREALVIFLECTLWEFHCINAFHHFSERLNALKFGHWNCLASIRTISIGLSEIDRHASDSYSALLQLPNLKSLTVSPRREGWATIDIHAVLDGDSLKKHSVVDGVYRVLSSRQGFQPLRDICSKPRGFVMYFVFPVRYIRSELPHRWVLEFWRANLNNQIIDRDRMDMPLGDE